FGYGYDAVGNKLYQQDLRDPQQSELYGYDAVDRLTSWERGELSGDKSDILHPGDTQSWDLDPVGNWDATTIDGTTETRQHNDVNELIHRKNHIDADLRYDANGNLIEDHRFEYSYDAFNRLVSATRKSEDRVGYYTYDAGNRRVTRLARPQSGPPVATSYAYDGWQVVEERERRGGGNRGRGRGRGGSGRETIRTYTYGNYIDEPITMTTSRGNRTYYYHTNNLYNVRALTDKNGNVRERYRYSAYGEPTILDPDGNERPRSAIGNRYMFQGRRYDPESGLYYYRRRMMSAELGRFVMPDTATPGVVYMYGGASPANYLDPTGMKKCQKKGKEICVFYGWHTRVAFHGNSAALKRAFKIYGHTQTLEKIEFLGSIATGAAEGVSEGVKAVVEELSEEAAGPDVDVRERAKELKAELTKGFFHLEAHVAIFKCVKKCGLFGSKLMWKQQGKDKWQTCPAPERSPQSGNVGIYDTSIIFVSELIEARKRRGRGGKGTLWTIKKRCLDKACGVLQKTAPATVGEKVD
ncbi:MAG: hypothetical protein KGZ25_13305, partial [Planctomycetes bacterium]|nr:hypothetical protein [Planctomycetota bacterium]